jgi:hypothetical protein
VRLFAHDRRISRHLGETLFNLELSKRAHSVSAALLCATVGVVVAGIGRAALSGRRLRR